MITQRIDVTEEFSNPNINYDIFMRKMKNRIENLEEDINNIKDPKVKGFAEEEVMKMRQKYFDYLKVDLELQHLVLSNPEIYGERGE